MNSGTSDRKLERDAEGGGRSRRGAVFMSLRKQHGARAREFPDRTAAKLTDKTAVLYSRVRNRLHNRTLYDLFLTHILKCSNLLWLALS
jgi:hypothetical protein